MPWRKWIKTSDHVVASLATHWDPSLPVGAFILSLNKPSYLYARPCLWSSFFGFVRQEPRTPTLRLTKPLSQQGWVETVGPAQILCIIVNWHWGDQFSGDINTVQDMCTMDCDPQELSIWFPLGFFSKGTEEGYWTLTGLIPFCPSTPLMLLFSLSPPQSPWDSRKDRINE
jgi:hypothetical protein